MALNREGLVAKLNATCRSALAGAAKVAANLTHYEIDLEHLLLRLSETTDSDVALIYRHFGIDASDVLRDLTRALDKAKRGNSRDPVISPRIVRLLSESWNLASVEYNASEVRSAFLLLALLSTDSLAEFVLKSCPEFAKLSIETLRSDVFSICSRSSEELSGILQSGKRSPESSANEQKQRSGSPKSNLDQYTVNLTEAARKGTIDPVLGRDFEVRQILDILTRRRQNNPILTGEAGVGKTAVVEGFALRIAKGDVPPSLKKVELRALDLALLQAGAGVKGEFENRLKGVIAEVQASPVPIVLFIDEAHTMIGAGGQAGQNDAANLLKPALARGELRTIAATTWSEYKKYFEKDAALARRFQVVKVDEPTEEQAEVMLRGVKDTLEKHHKVIILDESIKSAVRLSNRYISGRQLPDKAVSVLDTACARVSLAQHATPASLEDAHRQIESIETEIAILERESASGALHEERLRQLVAQKMERSARASELTERLVKERSLVQEIIDLRHGIEESVTATRELSIDNSSKAVGEPLRTAKDGTLSELSSVVVEELPAEAGVDIASRRKNLLELTEELAKLQGEDPMVRPYVESGTVAEVIAGWTGIPVGKMLKDEIQTVLNLENLLAVRVVGQDHALQTIAQRIQTARAGLDDPRRPVGVFLLVGPSGVGKTETALALADVLYGGERNLVTINMSEYQEPHSISGLKGSPPGYVGYGEGGVLTEAVRRKPYCVVLLDEMEKAHTDVMELFYQVFDKGFMEDGEGREVNFKNTVILMTSNAASDQLMALCSNAQEIPDPESLAEALAPHLRKIFKPALLGRLIVVPYYPMDDESLRQIIKIKLDQVGKRLNDDHRVLFEFSEQVVNEIANRCTEVESGARNIDHILTGTLLPEISTKMLARMVDGERMRTISIDSVGEEGFCYEIN